MSSASAPPSSSPSPATPVASSPSRGSDASSSSSIAHTPPMNIYQSIMSRPPNSPLSSSQYTAEAALHRPVAGWGGDSNSSSSSYSDSNAAASILNTSRLGLTMRALPYPQAWSRSSAAPGDLPPNFDWMSESCGSKAAIGVIGGGVMGLVMGVFMGALTDMTPPVTMIEGREVPQAPLREQARTTLRATADKSLYWCRQFAFITGVFGGTECLVEKYRGKHDVWNAVVSGCVTGAAMQAKQGPQASAIGCGGFAAFSLVIDSVMGTHS